MGNSTSSSTSKEAPSSAPDDEFGLNSTPVTSSSNAVCPTCADPILPGVEGKRLAITNGQYIMFKNDKCLRKFLANPNAYVTGVYDVATGQKDEGYVEQVMKRSPLRSYYAETTTVLPPIAPQSNA